MEQNEEVLIRVYQEKERQYKLQLDELKQKLRQSDDIRQQLQKSVQSLNGEKIDVQRKCSQIERELSQLKGKIDNQAACDSCRHKHPAQQTQSIYENNGLSNGVKPVPAPRLMNKVRF